MNRKPIINVIMILCGTALLILAIFVFNDDSVKQIAGLCYGFGAMSAALGIGGFLDRKLVSSVETEELKKRKEIEVHDGRNTRIREKVGATTNRIMFYLLNIVILACGILGESLTVILLLVGLVVVHLVLLIVLSNRYSKIM